jgi:hypothetical protein
MGEPPDELSAEEEMNSSARAAEAEMVNRGFTLTTQPLF